MLILHVLLHSPLGGSEAPSAIEPVFDIPGKHTWRWKCSEWVGGCRTKQKRKVACDSVSDKAKAKGIAETGQRGQVFLPPHKPGIDKDALGKGWDHPAVAEMTVFIQGSFDEGWKLGLSIKVPLIADRFIYLNRVVGTHVSVFVPQIHKIHPS